MTARSSILTELQLTVSATSLYRRSKINLTRARKLKMVYIVGRKKKGNKEKKDISDRIESWQRSCWKVNKICEARILGSIDRALEREREREWNAVSKMFSNRKTVGIRLPSLISIWLKFLFAHYSEFSTSFCLACPAENNDCWGIKQRKKNGRIYFYWGTWTFNFARLCRVLYYSE